MYFDVCGFFHVFKTPNAVNNLLYSKGIILFFPFDIEIAAYEYVKATQTYVFDEITELF